FTTTPRGEGPDLPFLSFRFPATLLPDQWIELAPRQGGRMTAHRIPSPNRDHPLWDFCVVSVALVVALVSARDQVGGWNDGSRLATVECLVDHHTLAIDRSTFAQDTKDKLFIDGHFYSDKSPLPAFWMAGLYQGWQWLTGLTASQRPDLFCYALAVAASGLAYVVAVWCIYQLGWPLRLPLPSRLILTASFALATVALPYTRYVNNHILLLAVA